MLISSGKKEPQIGLKSGFGRVLGSIWEGFGTLWGVSWVLLGRSLDLQNEAFLKHWSKISSKKPLGSILGRFWKLLGRVLEGRGKILLNFGRGWDLQKMAGTICDTSLVQVEQAGSGHFVT